MPASDVARRREARRMRDAASLLCLDRVAAAAANMRVRLMAAIAMLAQLLNGSSVSMRMNVTTPRPLIARLRPPTRKSGART